MVCRSSRAGPVLVLRTARVGSLGWVAGRRFRLGRVVVGGSRSSTTSSTTTTTTTTGKESVKGLGRTPPNTPTITTTAQTHKTFRASVGRQFRHFGVCLFLLHFPLFQSLRPGRQGGAQSTAALLRQLDQEVRRVSGGLVEKQRLQI